MRPDEIILKPLTILAGLNGSGKTDFLKALYVMKSAAPGVVAVYAEPTTETDLPSRRASITFMENPECGLHASLQTLVGKQAVLAVRNGLKVVIETHSEHILNAIRIGVREGRLPPEKVAIYWFERQPDRAIEITEIKVDLLGRLDHWPEGFFDEWDKTLEQLLLDKVTTIT